VRPSSVTGSDLNTVRRAYREAQGSTRWLFLIVLLELLAIPLVLLTPLPLAIAVDSALGNEPLPSIVAAVVPGRLESSAQSVLLLACVFQVVVVFLVHARGVLATYLQTSTGERITVRLRARLLSHAQLLSFAVHDTRGTADSIYRIQYDAPALQDLVLVSFIPLVTAVSTLGFMLAVIAGIDLALALVALAATPLLYAAARHYRRRIKPRYVELKRIESRALNAVQEIFSALRVIKAFGRENAEQQRFTAESEQGADVRVRVYVSEELFNLAVSLLTASGTALVLYLGISRVSSGALTLGSLLLVLSYLSQLYGPLQVISRQSGRMQGKITSAERVIELLDERPAIAEPRHPLPLGRCQGRIAIRNVSFAYGDVSVLQHVSLDVPPGTRVGIAGRTGAGKSTLLNLLLRFYDPTEGSIQLDGRDIRKLRLSDLRRQFGVVLQEPFLFSSTIGDNIAYSRPGAGREAITAAATAAGVHDFVQSLPAGYDTPVGERGMRLSGGERQRISLARAFLKDAPILLLDEPTSSVDVRTEAEIMVAMDRLMVGRTTFMIAHRLSTLDHCELMVEIHDARLHVARQGAVIDVTERDLDGRILYGT